MNNQITTAPERIWLQVCDENNCDKPFNAHEGVTWCEDKINETDIEYVRADSLNKLKREVCSFCAKNETP